ncbi:MAG: hypothetical protein AAF602_27760, partial [Myxococcota bacterium]
MSTRIAMWGLCAATLFVAACGNDGTGEDPTTPGPSGPPETLEDALTNLGIEVVDSPRVGPDGEPLPDDYAPLGSAASYGQPDEFSDDSPANRTDELLFIGTGLDAGGSRVNLVEKVGVEIASDFEPDFGTTTVLHTLEDADNEWIDGPRLFDATAGDVDRDGLDESIVAYVDATSAQRVVRLRLVDDAETGFFEVDDAIADGDGITHVVAETGDVDGDGADEVVLGISTATTAELWVLANEGDDWSVDTSIPLPVGSANSTQVTVRLAMGNLDYDTPAELVVVVNESTTGGRTARYTVLGDGQTGFAELDDGTITVTDGNTVVAGFADVALGDVDGDGLDEILMGGLSENGRCTESGTAGVFTVLDDLKQGLSPLVEHVFAPWEGFRQCPAFAAWRLEHVFVDAFDLDGDGVDEMHANQFVFEDLREAPSLVRLDTPGLDDAFLLDGAADAGQDITFDTVAVATGDVTGDGRENLLVYAQYHDDVRVFGLSQIPEVGWDQLSAVTTSSTSNSGNPLGSVLVPTNVDPDGPALIYGEGSYELVFTEPLVVAALAAAPCADGIGQNVDACATS